MNGLHFEDFFLNFPPFNFCLLIWGFVPFLETKNIEGHLLIASLCEGKDLVFL